MSEQLCGLYYDVVDIRDDGGLLLESILEIQVEELGKSTIIDVTFNSDRFFYLPIPWESATSRNYNTYRV